MKCPEHGCEMVAKVGWGNKGELVCPECEEEKGGKTTTAGWGNRGNISKPKEDIFFSGLGSSARVYPAFTEGQQ